MGPWAQTAILACPMQCIHIRIHKGRVCERILRALPDWFGIEEAICQYTAEVQRHPMVGVRHNRTIIAFASLKHHYRTMAEIYVMGILPQYHRRGIGKQLIQYCERLLKTKQVRFLTVKTVGPTRENKAYAATRKFYESVGFLPLEEFLGPWGPHNPCLLMVKPL